VLALIPARQGSKRFPGKNKASFLGKGLLEITYECASTCPDIEGIAMSSDDDELIARAVKLGIEVPFKRSAILSSDHANTWEVVLDFLHRTGFEGYVCVLQLTSPLRSAEDISETLRLAKANKNAPALSVRETLDGEHSKSWLCPCSQTISSSKHCESALNVVPNGGVYILHSSQLSLSAFAALEGCAAHLVPLDRSLDIDFESQLQAAEKEVWP